MTLRGLRQLVTLLAIALPLQIVRTGSTSFTQGIWLPIAVFEIVVAFWLLIKGVRPLPAAA